MAQIINEVIVTKTGPVFPRAYAAGLSYRYGELPFIEWFMENFAVYDDGTTESSPWPSKEKPVTKITGIYDATATYPLLHPETGDLIGEASDGALFAHLYSRWHRDVQIELQRIADEEEAKLLAEGSADAA